MRFARAYLEVIVNPNKRYSVSKYSSAKKFRRNISRTKVINISPIPMRGGIRL